MSNYTRNSWQDNTMIKSPQYNIYQDTKKQHDVKHDRIETILSGNSIILYILTVLITFPFCDALCQKISKNERQNGNDRDTSFLNYGNSFSFILGKSTVATLFSLSCLYCKYDAGDREELPQLRLNGEQLTRVNNQCKKGKNFKILLPQNRAELAVFFLVTVFMLS